MTQYRLEKETGIRQSRISLWLKGTGEPGMEDWGLLCQALDVPLSWFFEELGDTVPDYRTPEEQLLIRVARKVGIEAIWELIADAAVAKSAKVSPTSGPLEFVRERDEPEPRAEPKADPKSKPKP